MLVITDERHCGGHRREPFEAQEKAVSAQGADMLASNKAALTESCTSRFFVDFHKKRFASEDTETPTFFF